MKRDDPLMFVLLNEIGILEQLARHRLEKAMPEGLLQPHFVVLNHLVRLGDGKSPVRLARAFQVAKGAMTNTLQRLEARGLVRLEPDPDDGRGKRVFLTEAGRAMREAAVAALGPVLAELGRVLPAAKLRALLPPLQALRAHLDQAREAD